MGDELAKQLFATDNPRETFTKIEDVFVRNNLPLVGKVYRVFEILHPRDVLTQKLESNSALSPVLRQVRSDLRRRDIIYRDLLNIHIQTGNQSLSEYLQVIDSGASLAERFRQGEDLNEQEIKQLTAFANKLTTLYHTSALSRHQVTNDSPTPNPAAALDKIYADLRVREGQTLESRVCEMFLYPIGASSVKEALTLMDESISSANQRHSQERERKRGKFTLEKGSLIKGLVRSSDLESGNGFQILDNILGNGSVAKEYLGSASSSDATPFDTDCVRLRDEDIKDSFRQTFSDQASSGYGDILFVIRDRGQFQEPNPENPASYDPTKLELITSNVVSQNHTGVRTGFPITQVDFIIAKDEVVKNPRSLQNLFFSIAKTGIAIPVVDAEGNEIFTQEMFDSYRRSLAGIDRFRGESPEYQPPTPNTLMGDMVESLIPSVTADRENVAKRNQEIRQKIKTTLDGLGITLRDEQDQSLIGAELEDIGSTGRGTNLPGDYDFDYTLLLDPRAFKQGKTIQSAILEQISHEGTTPAPEGEVSIQIRMTGVDLESGEKLAVDIGINEREDGQVYGSHKAVAERLDSIAEAYGEEARDTVIANILVAKKLLKEGHAYKKGTYGDGGLGGIGVENWILQNGGSVEAAFNSFWEASHNPDGSLVDITTFRARYPIYDPGSNLRRERYHDNFAYTLTETGYQAMIEVIKTQRLKEIGLTK